MQTKTFERDDTTEFRNPERGFHAAQSEPSGFNKVWNDGWTVTRQLLRLDDFRNSDISKAWLDSHRNDFAAARSAGIKLILRYSYNYTGGGQDASLSRILGHIGQLGPIWQDNADTIASLQAGFVGAWGEWHSSSNGLTQKDPTARNQIVAALLKALPKSLMINLRYPEAQLEFLGGAKVPTAQTAFDGSDLSRLGTLNDCYLANATDAGTFVVDRYTANYATNETTKKYWQSLTRFVNMTGETCDVDWTEGNRKAGPAAIQDMIKYNFDTLNRDYSTQNVNMWINSGHFDEIRRRLGYRISLNEIQVPTSAVHGKNMSVTMTMQNTGFGKVYNPRPIDLILVSGGSSYAVRLSADARRDLPLGGETKTSTFKGLVPADVPNGTYSAYLSLPDPSTRLAGNVKYAIRLANKGNLWDNATGRHDLGMTVKVGDGT